MDRETSSRPLPHHPLRIVLIGTSLAGESDAVVRSGLAIARAAGGRIQLLHATTGPTRLANLGAGMGDDYALELRSWCDEQLQAQVARLGIEDAELAGAEVVVGVPHRALIDAARRCGADLIVLGAVGSGPFAADLLGSTADRVVRKASCPVLLVRGELPVPPRHVLAPVDLSDLSADAFRYGLCLLSQLSQLGGEIEVRAVHALSFVESLGRRQDAAEISVDEATRQSGEELAAFAHVNCPDAPLKLATEILPGEARFEILRDLSEHPVDLVLLGTHGRGGMDRLMLGSVATEIARKAPCSVLLLPPEATLGDSIAEAILEQTTPAWHPAAVS